MNRFKDAIFCFRQSYNFKQDQLVQNKLTLIHSRSNVGVKRLKSSSPPAINQTTSPEKKKAKLNEDSSDYIDSSHHSQPFIKTLGNFHSQDDIFLGDDKETSEVLDQLDEYTKN